MYEIAIFCVLLYYAGGNQTDELVTAAQEGSVQI